MNIGERITHALEMRGMTQKELANKTGLTEVTISRYINNQRVPRATHIIPLCKALYVSADWLLGAKEDGNTPYKELNDEVLLQNNKG